MINNSNSTTYLATNGTYSNLQLKDKKTKNDCTVRSLATAFDVSFRTAFKLAEKKFMREEVKELVVLSSKMLSKVESLIK